MKKHIFDVLLSLFLSLVIIGVGFYLINIDIVTFLAVNFYMFILFIILYLLIERKPLIRRTLKIISISGVISSIYISIIFYLLLSRIELGI